MRSENLLWDVLEFLVFAINPVGWSYSHKNRKKVPVWVRLLFGQCLNVKIGKVNLLTGLLLQRQWPSWMMIEHIQLLWKEVYWTIAMSKFCKFNSIQNPDRKCSDEEWGGRMLIDWLSESTRWLAERQNLSESDWNPLLVANSFSGDLRALK